MIDAIGRVMLYVNNPRSVADFWVQKIGFVELNQAPAPDGTISVEIAPSKQADTTFVLFDRNVIAKYEPELTLGTPSVLLSCSDIDATHKIYASKGVAVGEIMTVQGMRTFNFPDNEGNYFAVRELI